MEVKLETGSQTDRVTCHIFCLEMQLSTFWRTAALQHCSWVSVAVGGDGGGGAAGCCWELLARSLPGHSEDGKLEASN